MKRSFREKRNSIEIPAPTGTEWLAIGDIHLWLLKEKRKKYIKVSEPTH